MSMGYNLMERIQSLDHWGGQHEVPPNQDESMRMIGNAGFYRVILMLQSNYSRGKEILVQFARWHKTSWCMTF
eukprot:11785476-Ditylum_brightwellii.AAC.1